MSPDKLENLIKSLHGHQAENNERLEGRVEEGDLFLLQPQLGELGLGGRVVFLGFVHLIICLTLFR